MSLKFKFVSTCQVFTGIIRIMFMIKKDNKGLPVHLGLSRLSRLGRITLYCYSVSTDFTCCIPFLKWEERAVEGGLKKALKISITAKQANYAITHQLLFDLT